MKIVIIAATAFLAAAPLMAQERSDTDARGYVAGAGGFGVSLGNSTAATDLEGGVRVARHVMLFGSVGHYRNLQGELQTALDTTTAALSASQGLDVIGSGSLPATFGLGGVRMEIPAGRRVLPYVLAGIGVARLHPTAAFTYADGTMPDGSTPDVGTDVTGAMTSAGIYTVFPSSHRRMETLGAGMQVPVTRHWMVDAGYRFGRIAADAPLSSGALNTNGMTFGVGYRF
jgi:opacity protein-like surface antigen